MPVVISFLSLINIDTAECTKEECRLLEATIFDLLCAELQTYLVEGAKDYFRILKLPTNMERSIMESTFLKSVINDILASGEYSLSGIAYYTDTPSDVLDDIMIGNNERPSLLLSRKIIELHRSVRPSLYRLLLQKILRGIKGDFMSMDGQME